MIVQLAEQLSVFSSVTYPTYCLPVYKQQSFDDFKDALAHHTSLAQIDIAKIPSEYQPDVEFLKTFFDNNAHLAKESGTAVFVHDDLQFENILHVDGKLTSIIDLDWSCQAPVDYNLRSITNFLAAPGRFVEETQRPRWKGYNALLDFTLLRKYCPVLFAKKDVAARVRLYTVASELHVISDFQEGRWSDNAMKKLHRRVEKIYRSDWLERMLVG